MNRSVLAVVLIVAVVGVILAAVGVFRFQNTEDESTFMIDKKALKEGTEKALDKTGKALENAGRELREPTAPPPKQRPAAPPKSPEKKPEPRRQPYIPPPDSSRPVA